MFVVFEFKDKQYKVSKGDYIKIPRVEKLKKNDDINFIEQEFNDFMLEDGFKTLFLFPKLKEFIKSITSEVN